MSISDLRELDANREIGADICIVGSGPAGLSLALQFETMNLQVCVLESGGLSQDAQIEDLNEIDGVGARRAPQNVTRCRGLGGTSALWTGRCGTFDHIDFQHRSWVKFSGWPIGYEDISTYFDKAGRLLGLGPAIYDERWSDYVGSSEDRLPWDQRVFRPTLFQYSRASAAADPVRTFAAAGVQGAESIGALQHAGAPRAVHFGEAHVETLRRSKTIHVWLYATATSVETNAEGTHVESVKVTSQRGNAATVKAPIVVLACGGIDNARLLLMSRSQQPHGVGNARDTVGRFLTDHPLATVATYRGDGDLRLRRRLGHRWYDLNGSRYVYMQGLRISPELQRQEELLNCAIHVLEYGDRPATVSVAGRLVRSLRSGKPGPAAVEDLRTILSHPVSLMSGAIDRYARHRPALAPTTSVALCCAVEQVLDPESRVMLSDKLDWMGLPRARIDWKIGDAEYRTAKRTTDLLMAEIARLGYAPPDLASWFADAADGYRSVVHDMAHPMSSTRMSNDPTTGVVDKNCMVHGVDGLYVTGSSVFSTAGYMNPTMMIVALSLRLADHLKRVMADQPEPRKIKEPFAVSAEPLAILDRRVRVGLVGIGHRIRRIYLPVLARLADRYEIVGFCGRSQEKSKEFATETDIKAYDSVEDLATSATSDFLIAAISTSSIDDELPKIISAGRPVLVETPLAWNVAKGQKLVELIRKRGLLVGVAEQTPFLPKERLNQRIVELGLIGRVLAVENSFAFYDYHGIAALRAYVGAEISPVRLTADILEFPKAVGEDGSEQWTLGQITTTNGSRLIHQYSDAYFDSPSRSPKTLRVYGTSGTIDGDKILFANGKYGIHTAMVTSEDRDGVLHQLSVDSPLGEITWQNPFWSHELGDPEHIAVATLLEGMTNAVFFGGAPLYGSERALFDMEIMTGLRLSAEARGAEIPVPASIWRRYAHKVAAKVPRRGR